MIIGVTGLIGSGKDTIASHLVEKYGYERYSWAAPLKDMTAMLFGWDRDMLEGTTTDLRAQREIEDEWWSVKLGKSWSPRLALQILGTEIMRNTLHPDIWVLAGMKRIAGKTNVVIPDTRFPNEIKAIREMGGVIWNVQRGSIPNWYFKLIELKKDPNFSLDIIEWFMRENYPEVHASEYSWVGTTFDAVFENNSTIEELKRSVDLIIGN
jgi:hypothetical protein